MRQVTAKNLARPHGLKVMPHRLPCPLLPVLALTEHRQPAHACNCRLCRLAAAAGNGACRNMAVMPLLYMLQKTGDALSQARVRVPADLVHQGAAVGRPGRVASLAQLRHHLLVQVLLLPPPVHACMAIGLISIQIIRAVTNAWEHAGCASMHSRTWPSELTSMQALRAVANHGEMQITRPFMRTCLAAAASAASAQRGLPAGSDSTNAPGCTATLRWRAESAACAPRAYGVLPRKRSSKAGTSARSASRVGW